MVLVLVALTALLPLLLSLYATGAQGGAGIEWRTLLCGLVGLWLLGCAFMAVGLFVSTLTESQVVAAIVTFLVLVSLWVIGNKATDFSGAWKDVMECVAAIGHLQMFARGSPTLADLTYYLSLIALGLFLAHRAIEARRWG